MLGFFSCLLAASCFVPDPLFCKFHDDCKDAPGNRRVCDANGTLRESNYVANTCVALEPAIDAGSVDAVDARPELSPDAAPVDDASAPDAAPPPDAGPPVCTPLEIICDDSTNRYSECDRDGQYVVEPFLCPLDCHANLERCNDLAPSNGLLDDLDEIVENRHLRLTGTARVQTDDGEIFDGTGRRLEIEMRSSRQEAGGQDIRVLRVSSVHLEGLVVEGTLAFAIVSDGDIKITGTVDASGKSGIGGAGAPITLSPADSRPCFGSDGVAGGGGGGGGRLNPGGKGGKVSAGTQAPGGTSEPTVSGNPLQGGCQGGSAQDDTGVLHGARGGGGGALQFVSRTRIEVSGLGRITVGGGGGGPGGGGATASTHDGGQGGGSGGLVVMEAPAVLLDGVILAAQGGAGGASALVAGEDGGLSFTAARGGSCTGCASGGAGGFGNQTTITIPFAGSNATGATPAGGGGGSVGAFVFKTDRGQVYEPNGTKILGKRWTGSVGRR